MDILEILGDTLSSLWEKLYDILPKSPIVYLSSNDIVAKYLGYINWFIPIYSMISVLEGWLVAVSLYYIVQVVLRWAKMIE